MRPYTEEKVTYELVIKGIRAYREQQRTSEEVPERRMNKWTLGLVAAGVISLGSTLREY